MSLQAFSADLMSHILQTWNGSSGPLKTFLIALS